MVMARSIQLARSIERAAGRSRFGGVTSDDILDVDLLAFEKGTAEQRRAVVDGTMESLKTGFVYTRHDISADLLDTAYDYLQRFFSLPQEQKDRSTVAGSNGQTGYTPLLVETAASAEVPDWKEMYNWGAELPEGHPLRKRLPHRYSPPKFPDDLLAGMSEVMGTFHQQVWDLQRRFLKIIAVGIGAHEDFFEFMLKDGATLTRAIHYPEMQAAPGADHVWAGEHADINLITALPRSTAKGLEVKLEDGSWIDAAPPDDGVVINTGMMLEHLTNGVIPPGRHRVVADQDQPGDRYSVVQFCHPTPWTILSPVPSCVTDEYPLRYPSITASDRLEQVIFEINLVEDGRRVGKS